MVRSERADKDPSAGAPRPTACAAATEILNHARCDLALWPGDLKFLDSVERGEVPLTARVIERVLQMRGWVGEAARSLESIKPAAAARPGWPAQVKGAAW